MWMAHDSDRDAMQCAALPCAMLQLQLQLRCTSYDCWEGRRGARTTLLAVKDSTFWTCRSTLEDAATREPVVCAMFIREGRVFFSLGVCKTELKPAVRHRVAQSLQTHTPHPISFVVCSTHAESATVSACSQRKLDELVFFFFFFFFFFFSSSPSCGETRSGPSKKRYIRNGGDTQHISPWLSSY